MEKLEQVKKFSNPQEVYNKGRQYGLTVYLSPNKKKKYTIVDPNNKITHFGQLGYEDYTKHLDEIRREQFLKRNAKWKDAEPYSPAWLSYYLLW
jgi:hypothetical protein